MIVAIVPAAGQSRRMGRPKLLLKFNGESLIRRVISALKSGGVASVIVVVPPTGQPEGVSLAKEARNAGATVVIPAQQPAEMRDSVELALETIHRDEIPEAVVLAPADSPGISTDLVAGLLRHWARFRDSIVIPCAQGRRGHPIVLPWSLAESIPALPGDVGVNALVTQYKDRVVELEVDRPDLVADLDTPEDLERWREVTRACIPADESGIASHKSDTVTSATTFRVKVRLFAVAKQRAGRSEIEADLTSPATAGDLERVLSQRFPELGSLFPGVLIAVDADYATSDTPIHPGARVALIPPVSGGASTRPTH